MKTLKDFYLEKKKEAFLNIPYTPKTKQKESQESLNRYLNYIPRLRKLKEAEHFREEWLEPETSEIKTQA